MALELVKVENTPFEWVWEEDADVGATLIPCHPRIERAVARSESISIEVAAAGDVDSVHMRPEQMFRQTVGIAEKVTRDLHGIEPPGGGEFKPTRVNLEWLAEQHFGFVFDLVEAARARYQELAALPGKSQTPQSGSVSSAESTASDSQPNVKLVSPDEVSGHAC